VRSTCQAGGIEAASQAPSTPSTGSASSRHRTSQHARMRRRMSAWPGRCGRWQAWSPEMRTILILIADYDRRCS
jgi:hypothetical protein